MTIMKIVQQACWAVLFFSVSRVGHAQPAHHWDLDSSSGLLAPDRAGCGTGKLLGFENADDSQWVAGQRNGALDLGIDGSLDNRVEVSLSPIGTGAGFTVACWINPGEQIVNPGEYQILSTPGDVVGFKLDGVVHGDGGQDGQGCG